MSPSDLHLIVAFNNPCMWESRLSNMRKLEDHLLKSAVSITTIELQYHNRPHQLEDKVGIRRLRFKTKDVLWHKENLLNVAETHLPDDAEYVGYIDGDIFPQGDHWPIDILHALQIHKAVQFPRQIAFLGPHKEIIGTNEALVHKWRIAKEDQRQNGGSLKINGHGFPGGGWAFRRETWKALRGLPDKCIIGAGDHHAAQGMLSMADRLSEPDAAIPFYSSYIKHWQDRAKQFLNHDVGQVPGLGLHYWHGKTADRKYPDRWQILRDNEFNPFLDVRYDENGILILEGNKPKLRDDIRAYFFNRNEDVNSL